MGAFHVKKKKTITEVDDLLFVKPLSVLLCCGYRPTSCDCSEPAEAVKQGCLRGIYYQLSYGMQKNLTTLGQ